MASTGKVMLKSLLKPTNLVIAGVTAMIVVLHKTNEAVEEVRERADELSNTFNNNKSDIEGYKDKIEDLYKTINDSGSSLEEVTTARQTLMTVQDELIDKFGDEKETIDLVTQAIYGQSSALDELIKKQWQETKNEFNESDIWNDFANWQEGYSDNIDRMVHEMENAWGNIKMSTSDYFGGEYDDIIKRLEEAGWEYSSAYETFIKGGSVEDLYEEIIDIQTLVGDDMPENFLKSLADDANELKATLDNYEGMWDNYILNDKIFADDNLADSWKEVNDAYTKYQNAVASGDKTAIEEATSGFATSINEVLNDKNVGDSVKDYFKDMYPALYREVEKWEFKTNIIPEFDTSGLQGKTQSDVLEMLQTEGTQDGESTFNSIIDSAIKYGLILDDDTEGIQKILDLLVEWGILQGTITDTAPKNPDEITDLTTISQSVSQIAQQLKPQFDELGEAYKDIFTTDGFTLENVGNEMLESLRASFQDINDDLQEIGLTPIDSSELDKFLGVLSDVNSTEQEVQQAFNDIATTWLYSTDVINGLNDATAESIEKQLEEMGVTNAQEVVDAALNQKKLELAASEEFLAKTGKDLAAATSEEVQAFIWSGQAADETADHFIYLALQKQVAEHPLNTAEDINNLALLCSALGVTGELYYKILDLKMAFNAVEAGAPIQAYQGTIDRLQTEIQALLKGENQIEIGFKVPDSGSGSASSAGKEAADAYVEAYEEELKELENLRDRGEISESEYLSRMKALYEKYFAGISKYQDKYFEEQSKYLEGMKSLYDSALSGISKLMSNQIDSVQEERDVTITALEEERDARLEVIDAQKEQLQAEIDLIDEQIEAKQEIIDGIQDEIDAMRDANEERKRQIELQKAQYELERMQNQRTDLIYKNGQMVYVADTEGIRDARENVEDAKLEIEIAEKEKEISLIEDEIELLEKQKDAIQDQIDALDKQADSIEKYYSKMITQQERYYDSLIKNMEKQKSKWEELAEIQEVAEAYSAIEQVFGDLGYTVEDVLNGSTGVFEDFKTKYIGLINDMNSNSSFAEGLSYATGLAEENLGSFLGKTQEVSQGLDDLSSKGEGLNIVAENMDKIGTSATALTTNTEGLNENLSTITDSLSNLPTSEGLTGWVEGFNNLGLAIKGVAEALGLAEENSVGSLITALQSISEVSLGGTEEGTGIISQFIALKEAVDSVTSSISGGASGGSEGDASGSKSSSMSAGATEGGEGGLVSAIEKMGESAIETLGEGSSEDGSEGEGEGVIGKFAQLKTAVDSVTTAIGTGEEEEGSGEEGATTLIGALQKQYEKAEEVLPEEKLLFEELLISIEACVAALNNMTSSMSAMFEIGFPSGGISFTPLAKGTVGKAFAKGTGKYDGLPHNEKNALRSEYGQPELTVYPDGTTELTTEPTMSDLPKNTVIFNEEQTKRIMDGRGDILGNVFRDGTINNDSILLSHVGSLQKDDSGYALMKSFEIYQDMLSSQIVPTLNTIENNTDTVARNISNINNNNTQPAYVLNGGINVTCPNVTDAEIAKRVGGEIEKAFFGMSNYANQRSSITR